MEINGDLEKYWSSGAINTTNILLLQILRELKDYIMDNTFVVMNDINMMAQRYEQYLKGLER